MIKEVVGDVTSPLAGTDAHVFVPHICNNVKAYAAGVAASIRGKWPAAYLEYMKMTQRLGHISVAKCSDNRYSSLSVVNMIAQEGLRSATNPRPIRYAALARCMERTALYVKEIEGAEIHCPMFGVGLAGGDWDVIKPLIAEIWSEIPVTIYKWRF